MNIKRIVYVLCIMLTVGLATCTIVLLAKRNREAPVITIPEESVTYREGDSWDILLQGVTAQDTDGNDLTDRIGIGKIVRVNDSELAQVEYCVFDEEGNLSKAVREVIYETVEEVEETEETVMEEIPEEPVEEPVAEPAAEPAAEPVAEPVE